MKTELRFFLINDDNREDSELSPFELTDEQFMDESERQGIVYSVQGFQEAFNSDCISDQWYIRILEMPIP